VLINLIQTDEDANILSAPRILTLDNQEATILVGEKFPIIKTDVSSSGGAQNIDTSLEYYENIGIQLNVIPQVCDGSYINMIVHPAVSEIKALVTSGENEFPRLNVREAETQILLKSRDTAVIGGLQDERDKFTVKRVPFLGDIPYLGRLFRQEKTDKTKIELLIFIKASIIEPEEYAAKSAEKQEKMQKAAGLGQKEEADGAVASKETQSQSVPAAKNAETETAPIVKIEEAAPSVANKPTKKYSPAPVAGPIGDDATQILEKMVAEAEAK
ncbi:MAG: type II and III secretion system protein, partial [Kiritimatiellales bacterium]|nr:type II and III secretion system protein [Kiritimatiellales bacterium]